jgi:hypothetical protein
MHSFMSFLWTVGASTGAGATVASSANACATQITAALNKTDAANAFIDQVSSGVEAFTINAAGDPLSAGSHATGDIEPAKRRSDPARRPQGEL